jgi:hypothetical protein
MNSNYQMNKKQQRSGDTRIDALSWVTVGRATLTTGGFQIKKSSAWKMGKPSTATVKQVTKSHVNE